MEGWQARRIMRKIIVLALASWPANIEMNMLPSTSAGVSVGRLCVLCSRPV